MTITSAQREEIEKILKPVEIVHHGSPTYEQETKVWSANKFGAPAIVLKPKSLESLKKIVPYLYSQDLDFAIRSQGFGDSSASDVVLNISAFDQIDFDSSDETVVLGAGQSWGEVYKKLESVAPGYAVVGARTPPAGVAGAVLGGGLSWLSHEYGMSSDPHNLFDAQIVLSDGRSLWASEEPELLWALRGGGGNFGVVTAFKMKAYKYEHKIYSGFIVLPPTALEEVSRALSDFAKRCHDPKVACHVFIMNPGSPFFNTPNGIGVMPYDANGVEHGRETFAWALNINGAMDQTNEFTLNGVHDLQAFADQGMMKTTAWMSGALVKELDPEFLIRASEWFYGILESTPALVSGSFMLIEFMQKPVLDSVSSPEATAWPHGKGQRHVLQIGTGYLPDADCTKEVALKALQAGVKQIAPEHIAGEFLPNWIETSLMDINEVYKGNFDKLKEIKAKYDQRGRFNKGISFGPS